MSTRAARLSSARTPGPQELRPPRRAARFDAARRQFSHPPEVADNGRPIFHFDMYTRLTICAGLAGLLASLAPPAASAQEIPDSAPAGRDAPSGAGNPDLVITGDTGLLDVHVRDVELTAALELLSYQARSNIVTSTSVKGRISANLYSVTFADALDALLTPNNFAYRQMGSTVFVGTPEEVAAQSPPPQTRVFRLKYISKAEALAAVTGILGQAARVGDGSAVLAPKGGENSGPMSVVNSINNAQSSSGSGGLSSGESTASVEYLILTDTPDRLDRVEKLLREIDERPRQVLIEATILRATLNEDNAYGIDFTLLGGVDFQTVGSVSDAAANVRTGQLPIEDFEDTSANLSTNLIGDITRGFTFGIIRNNVAAFLRALEDVTDVTIMANPKILALNRQEAEVIVGRRDGYITTTVTETAAVQKIEFLETGTQVRLRPHINDDGSVRIAVHPKDSNGGLTVSNLPFEETTEAKADILVNDGHTVLIGGLFRERTVTSRTQVPILGDIPGIGLLAQKQRDSTVREEVIILLTVHVLKNTKEEQEHVEAMLEDVERVRVGSRKGLLFSGRERLAQAFYQAAIRDFENGDDGLALLNARMALHNQPRHLSALKLKEELLGRRLWESEGARSRTLMLDLIRSQRNGRAAPGEVFDRPEPEGQLRLDSTPTIPEGKTP